MKQIILITVVIVLIPYLVVSFFSKEIEITYEFDENITVKVLRTETNIIDEVPLEEYIVGVVAGEMPVAFHTEALKSGAVAARTYVLKRIINSKNDYDVVDTILNQVYLDENHLKNAWGDEYVTKINRLRKAVNDTKGEYITYKGKIIDALYFSTSNGWTENSEDIFKNSYPYLKSVESMWDIEASPVFNDQEVYALTEFYNKLNLPFKAVIEVDIIDETKTGRIISLKINEESFDARTISSILNLRSTDFKIIQEKDMVYIDTTGYGHGVGMSQYGANGMAKSGYSYDEILKHYYSGTSIKKF